MINTLYNSLLKIGMLFLVLIAPIQAIMITVGVLIFTDLGTGVWAAIKRKEQVTSAAIRRTLSKMLIYQLAIISGFLIEHFILNGDIPVVKIVAGFIGLVEFKSILENSNTILGTNVFKALISKLGSKNDQL